MSTYWLTVTAQEWVKVVQEKGYTQVNMGPKAPLDKMSQGDWILYYSPTIFHQKPTSICQKFTGISSVIDNIVYPQNAKNPQLWRRNVEFFHSMPKHAHLFHQYVDFLKEYEHWIDAFFQPVFEISRNDFIFIAEQIIIPTEYKCLLF